MKRTDLSIIMRTAWQMCRATGVTFAECLHKAWQVFKLKIKMRAGIVQFFYLKSSTGELRQAFGTLKDDLCPETKGDDRKPNKHLVTYYDTVAEGWRSFRMFNFVKDNYNLLCSIWGYRYYEVYTEENTYILISGKCIRNKNEIKKFIEVTDYMGLIINEK